MSKPFNFCRSILARLFLDIPLFNKVAITSILSYFVVSANYKPPVTTIYLVLFENGLPCCTGACEEIENKNIFFLE